MKTTANIFLTLMLLWLSACASESFEPDVPDTPGTKGVMEIEIVQQDGEAEDKMNTIRFLVFKQTSGFPELELNELFDIPAVSGAGEASELRIILEVTRKENGDNSKIVVAVVNEPYSLGGIRNFSELEDLTLDFAGFLNENHTKLAENGKGLPMTGEIQTNKVYPTEVEARATPAALVLERAVARVDVYLRKEAGVTTDLAYGTNISLHNTYDKEYFIRYKNGTGLFGPVQTVTSGFISQTWEQSSSPATEEKEIPDTEDGARLICSFYTPERTCHADQNADKLAIEINITSTDGSTRNGTFILDKFQQGNNPEETIEAIYRNNNYRITGTVEVDRIGMELQVTDWQKALDEDYVITPVYELSISKAEVNLLTITEETVP